MVTEKLNVEIPEWHIPRSVSVTPIKTWVEGNPMESVRQLGANDAIQNSTWYKDGQVLVSAGMTDRTLKPDRLDAAFLSLAKGVDTADGAQAWVAKYGLPLSGNPATYSSLICYSRQFSPTMESQLAFEREVCHLLGHPVTLLDTLKWLAGLAHDLEYLREALAMPPGAWKPRHLKLLVENCSAAEITLEKLIRFRSDYLETGKEASGKAIGAIIGRVAERLNQRLNFLLGPAHSFVKRTPIENSLQLLPEIVVYLPSPWVAMLFSTIIEFPDYRRCACGKIFKVTFPGQKYCSRSPGASRSECANAVYNAKRRKGPDKNKHLRQRKPKRTKNIT